MSTKPLLLASFCFATFWCGTPSVDPETTPKDASSQTPPLPSLPEETITDRANQMEQISGQYIVVLRDDIEDVESNATEIAHAASAEVGHLFKDSIKGFVLSLHGQALPDWIRNDSRVLFVQQDGVANLAATNPAELTTGIKRIHADINQTTSAGTGLGVAVLDTGIALNHPDLFVKGNVSFVAGSKTGNDEYGHGTAVAGIIGAKENGTGVVGVSPGVDLYAVKVVSNVTPIATWSDVIKGVDWVTQNRDKIAVVNMSMGGPGADDGNCGNTNGDALHKAICKSVATGVVYVVAAGNDADNVAKHIPAAYEEVITVSAMADSDGKPNGTGGNTINWVGNHFINEKDDTFASFSNFGAGVDLIAPGVNIRSTFLWGTYINLSGTSLSAPHVTGTVALWIAKHGRPQTGNAKDPAIRAMISQISEPVGNFRGDPDGIAEPLLNADTLAVGGTGSSVCCVLP